MPDKLAERIQNALRKHFEGVVVVQDKHADPEDVWYHVYFLPDEKRVEWVRFMINEYGDLAEAYDLPELPNYLFHTVSETKKNYPDVWRSATAKARAIKNKRVGKTKRVAVLKGVEKKEVG